MQPRPSFDRSLLIPIAIGIVSILGICWILSSTVLGRSSSPPTATPSSFRPFETRTPSPSASATPTREETPSLATATRPGTPTETLPPTSTFTATLPTPSDTPTPGNIQPLASGRYDDVNPNIAYDPYWTALKNPSTTQAYLGTIHASNGIGHEASFRFTGKRFNLGYQRGASFGTVTVIVDDQTYSFNEQAFDLVWHSPQLSPGDHFVRIIHDSGESINLDYIDIVQ